MVFKGKDSDIEFQLAGDDGREFGYEYSCYECNLVTRNLAESMFGDGHCRLRNAIDAALHLKMHLEAKDLVPNKALYDLQYKLKNIALFHQSAMSPGRRKDGSRSAFLESAFFDQWLHEQKTNLFYGASLGEVSHREAIIAATLMQWLGTNCGFAFLTDALKRAGLEIKKIDG